jgi:hypothetical protein
LAAFFSCYLRHPIGTPPKIGQLRDVVWAVRSHQSPSGCRFTTRMRLRIMNRLAGFASIAAANAARARSSERHAIGQFLKLLIWSQERTTKNCSAMPSSVREAFCLMVIGYLRRQLLFSEITTKDWLATVEQIPLHAAIKSCKLSFICSLSRLAEAARG